MLVELIDERGEQVAEAVRKWLGPVLHVPDRLDDDDLAEDVEARPAEWRRRPRMRRSARK